MKYDILLWDIDGTLMDFKRAEAQALSQSLEEVGVKPTPQLITEYSRINISYWKRLETGELTKGEVLLGRFVEFLGKKGIKAEAEPFLTSYEEHLSHAWFIQDDSLELCKKLREEGVRQYVVTNGWVDVQKTKLRESGFDKVLDGSFISDELGVPKPQKEFFEVCFEQIFGTKTPTALELKRVLIIGDSLTSDMKGGINAGIDCCWYRLPEEMNTENISLTYEIEDLWQIWEILKDTD